MQINLGPKPATIGDIRAGQKYARKVCREGESTFKEEKVEEVEEGEEPVYEEQERVTLSYPGYNDLREVHDLASKHGLMDFIRLVMEKQRISDN